MTRMNRYVLSKYYLLKTRYDDGIVYHNYNNYDIKKIQSLCCLNVKNVENGQKQKSRFNSETFVPKYFFAKPIYKRCLAKPFYKIFLAKPFYRRFLSKQFYISAAQATFTLLLFSFLLFCSSSRGATLGWYLGQLESDTFKMFVFVFFMSFTLILLVLMYFCGATLGWYLGQCESDTEQSFKMFGFEFFWTSFTLILLMYFCGFLL